MSSFSLRRRTAAASVALAVTVGLVGAAAAATPVAAATGSTSGPRDADTDVVTTYLSDTLGLPSNTVIETVTYDRFAWLLEQEGRFAFVVGSTEDAGFQAGINHVDTAARAAGISTVYWFDPNLSGLTGAQVVDVRSPGEIPLAESAQAAFSKVWTNVIGQHLGNGYAVTRTNVSNVTVVADDDVVNDSNDPVWDYRSDAESPAVGADEAVFVVYDKDNTSDGDADKVIDWVNLSTSDEVASEVAAAVTTAGGGAQFDEIAQFEWWKDAANSKHRAANGYDPVRHGDTIIEDSDDDAGWRVQQITYPELLHLLDYVDEPDTNFVILLGGTWCPNTRAVIKQINAEAQANGVTTVYNFDLVLDGGQVNGTNGAANPIHTRSPVSQGNDAVFRPSHLYGDVLARYFQNIETQYQLNPNHNPATYYPGGDLNAELDAKPRLQVPFLLNYERGTGVDPSATAITRQWIRDNSGVEGASYPNTEYMTNWWFTAPVPRLGLNFDIPEDESTLTEAQQGQLRNARASREFAQEAVEQLAVFFGGLPGPVVSTRTVSAPQVTYGTAPVVDVSIENAFDRTASGDLELSVAGDSYTAAITDDAASFTLDVLPAGTYPFTVSYGGDGQVLPFEETGSLTVAAANVQSVGVTTVTAATPSEAGVLDVDVVQPTGLAEPTGSVSVTVTRGSDSHTVSGALVDGTARLALPLLPEGTWSVQARYEGDTNYRQSSVTSAPLIVGAGDPDDVADEVTISLPSTTLQAGSEVELTIDNLAVSWIEVGIQSEYQRLATAGVSGSSATVTVTIPADIELGVHHLVVLDANGNELASVEVTIVAGDGVLSDTGASGFLAPLAVALGLIGLGTAAAYAARRRVVA